MTMERSVKRLLDEYFIYWAGLVDKGQVSSLDMIEIETLGYFAEWCDEELAKLEKSLDEEDEIIERLVWVGYTAKWEMKKMTKKESKELDDRLNGERERFAPDFRHII